MSNMEWLWLSDAEEFDPSALSVPEKLAKHGYACILNRMETGKVQAAQLCVHDVLSKNENPNIAIICPERLIKSWYSSMLWDMGVEFKYFGVSPRSLNLYSDSMANYCLISAESVIKDGEKSVLFKAGEGFIWDLMFVDLPMPG
ncbi:MAG: hypothetical protein FWE60_01850, partial [Oscillospiraceae bacterium]|nr:hypothetical protein [Oscillospiraceae bacterium]